MGQFLLGRFLQMILVLVAITAIVFLMLHIAPGDPLSTILGTKAGRVSDEAREELRRDLGLDKPLPVQYFTWLGRAMRGDLGRSPILRQEIAPLIAERLKATAILAAGALLLAAPLGVLAGVAAAVRRNSATDRLVSAIATMGICVPAFFLGQVLIILFALRLGWLPAAGIHSVGKTDIPDLLRHLILPAICLGLPAAAVIARMTRSSMVDVMTQGYVTTARAKGLGESLVTWRHAFRNALVSVITVVGLEIGFLLGGAVLVEVVFSWPGIGYLMWDAVLRRDFPMVQGAVLVVASSYVLINFVVDLLYAYIDPRIRLAR
jgi:ABC-type dipeptide/oligopeptide/nickel transport system permease component